MWYVFGGALLVAGLLAERAKRRRAEDELRASRQEQQRLTGQLIEAQECERRRVARELHDDLSQGLALLAVELVNLARQPSWSASESAVRLEGLSDRVKELSSVVHALSHQLHPSKLEHLGLVAAAQGLCREVSRHHGLDVKLTHSGVPDTIPPATALCLYRVVQEALRNVVRHSGTDHATVELSGTPAGIQLIVSDDGAGFEPAAALCNGGLGLVSMRERLHLVGGELTIDARPAHGTRIDARVPAPLPDRPKAEGLPPCPEAAPRRVANAARAHQLSRTR
jgi:signal transduction histidine kinase